jgi:DNA-binding NtrC family response regulator
MAARVLVMEDDAEAAEIIASALTADGFDVDTVQSARLGLPHLSAHPVDCVLLDYRLQDMDGLQCLRLIRQAHPELPVIVVTGWGSEKIAVEAMKLGASDYIKKEGRYHLHVPVKVREALGSRRLATTKAGNGRTAARATDRLSREVLERYRMDGIIGRSPTIAAALAQAEMAARSRTTATVLLEGETGTGKELFARAIHDHSTRAAGPFLAQNCAALPEPLLESELFGHVRGAFTGAHATRSGLFVKTDGGTLFLDEVSELPLALQPKLLRVVEDGVIRPVGGDEPRRVDVRVIAASNQDLRKASEERRFSRDLYHRLSVLPIRIPALRERGGDIRLLAEHFLRRFAEREGKRLGPLDQRTVRVLESYGWPGNVRELQNEMHRLAIRVDDGAPITSQLLSDAIRDATSPPEEDERPLTEILDEVRIAAIQDRLRRYGNRIGKTADSLGMSREWLWAQMRKLGLWRPREADDDVGD